MLRLTEDLAKDWLCRLGFPVPQGHVAGNAGEARAAALALGGAAMVKALIPAGRRGKAGAVVRAADADAVATAATRLLGGTVNNCLVEQVYVEACVAIRDELYLAFVVDGAQPVVLASLAGGVDVEDAVHDAPGGMARRVIDPIDGLAPWQALDLWLEAGLRGPPLAAVAALTTRLYQAFRDADALLFEVNPLALDETGAPQLVGTMMAIDPDALFRQQQWERAAARADAVAAGANPRERAVAEANRAYTGGECQYIELDGDIGLLVGGGGAGLYQHDLVLEAGGRPANHCVTPPTGADNRKLKAVLGAILDNPNLRGLLLGFNFAQMARTDIRVRTLVELLDKKRIDTARLPVVLRLFGAGESDSRAMVAGRPNVHYVPRGTTLKQAVDLIVRLVREQEAGS